MPSGRLGVGQDGVGALRIRPVVITGTVGDFVSQAAVVLRDQIAHGVDEFLCGVQGADIGNDDVAPLIQLAKVGVAQSVGPCGPGAGPKRPAIAIESDDRIFGLRVRFLACRDRSDTRHIPDGLLFFPIRTHREDRRDSAAFA